MLITELSILNNALVYWLRQHIRWRRQGLSLINEPKVDLFVNLDVHERHNAQTTADRLVHVYHLQHFRDNSTVTNFLENLFYLEMLEFSLNRANIILPESLNAIDVGVSHWFYVQTLYALLRWWNAPQGRQITLQGYENDPYRVYADLYSRHDHAEAHMAGIPETVFIPEAFTPKPASFSIATLLFPFIFLADHLKWGLPRRLFNPQKLIADIWISLKKDALLIIVNQGRNEADTLLDLLVKQSIRINTTFCFDSIFYEYVLPRYVTICKKDIMPS